MRRLFSLAFLAAACGGSDGGTILFAPGDSGNPQNDGSNNGDANNGMDSGGNPDSSPGNDAAPPFNVKSVNGLALWLKGDVGVTADGAQLVSAWADQSGNNNNATESRVGLLPKALASGINSLPSIHFASVATQGNDLLIADSPTLEWGTGDYLVEVVSRYTNDPTSVNGGGFAALYIAIYGPPETAMDGLGLYGNVPALSNKAKSTGVEAFIGGQPPAVSSGTGYNNNAQHVFGMQRVGTTLTVRLDGAVVGTQVVASVDIGKHGGRLGACENATAQRLEGDIGEVIAVKGVISAGDLAGIEGYLKARYATP